jgi:hypothetical protein
MISQEFVAQLLDAELTRAANFKDQRLLFGKDFAAGRSVGSTTVLLKSSDPLGLVPSPPLPQGRPGDATTTADQASIAELLVEPDPAKPRLSAHRSLLSFSGLGLWI